MLRKTFSILMTVVLVFCFLPYSSVSATPGPEGSFALAVKTDGTLWAWGRDDNVPHKIMDGVSNIFRYAYNDYGYYILKTDKSLLHIDYSNDYQPVKIMDNVVNAAMSDNIALALKTDGSLWTWGSNSHGQLGDGTNTDRTSPVKVMDKVSEIYTTGGFSMAIKTDKSLWAWGRNTYGQLGNGTKTDSNVPLKVMDGVSSVSLSYSQAFAVKADGTLWSWGGDGIDGNIDNITGDRKIPTKIMDSISSVSAGSSYTFAVKTDGSLWAWGANKYVYGVNEDQYGGRLGDGTLIDRPDPVKIMDDVEKVHAGSNNLAIKKDGSLWIWGNDFFCEPSSDETLAPKNVPTKIMDGVRSVSMGYYYDTYYRVDYYAMAIKTDGTLWACGYNEQGQLGDGTTEYRNEAVKIMDGVSAVKTGDDFSLIKPATPQTGDNGYYLFIPIILSLAAAYTFMKLKKSRTDNNR